MTSSRPPEGHHSTQQAARLAGTTYRCVDYWARRGHIAPTGSPRAPGSGYTRWWTDNDIATIRRIAERIAWGLTLDAAVRTVDPPLPGTQTPERAA